jgi:hypothetical protein
MPLPDVEPVVDVHGRVTVLGLRRRRRDFLYV